MKGMQYKAITDVEKKEANAATKLDGIPSFVFRKWKERWGKVGTDTKDHSKGNLPKTDVPTYLVKGVDD